jgi:hypothetical protein
MRLAALTIAISTLSVAPASARVVEVRANEATLELREIVDADEGYFPDENTRETVAKKLSEPALRAKVLKCSPMGRKFAIAMIDSGKRSRVTVAHPDRKLGTCLEKALAGINEPGYTLLVTVKLGPPPDTSPGRNSPVLTTP